MKPLFKFARSNPALAAGLTAGAVMYVVAMSAFGLGSIAVIHVCSVAAKAAEKSEEG